MSTAGTPPAGDGDRPKSDLSPEERAAFQKRADDIGRRLEAAKGTSSTLPKRSTGQAKVDGSAMGKAMRVSTELIGGILVGCGIGYGLDYAFGTGPLLFIVFFLLGAAAGMINIVRASAPATGASAGTTSGIEQASQTAADDDDSDDETKR